MTNEPTRLVDQDPEFARLVAASEDDGPSSAQVDEAVSLARRMVSAPRWRSWRWLGSGTAIVSASVLVLFVATSHSPRNSTASNGEVVTPFVVSPAPTFVAPAPPVPLVLPAQDPPAPASSPASVVRTVMAPRVRPVSPAASAERRDDAEVTAGRAEPSTFDEELRLLSAARSGLGTRDIPACLRAVDQYETRFRSGLFAQEMEVIRIDALATSGERARAHSLAERFLAANAKSAYAARVRSLAERTRD